MWFSALSLCFLLGLLHGCCTATASFLQVAVNVSTSCSSLWACALLTELVTSALAERRHGDDSTSEQEEVIVMNSRRLVTVGSLLL